MDRLHTCYAPVRRSPPMYCYTALPLDLHVLGLSLAFILSQDQTLRCKNNYNSAQNVQSIKCTWRELLFSLSNPIYYKVLSCTTSIASIFQRPLCGAFLLLNPEGSRFLESGCKITAFVWTDQIFSHFFSIFFVRGWFSMFVSITVFEVSCRTRLC